jgi:DNA end-binding protein Ku
MRAIWKGAITFGLVNIPVSLYPATRREELKFHLLRTADLSPINYKRVATADGKEVTWDQIVKGYEYEKGKFVVLKDEDFTRVDVEATQRVEIVNFVQLEKVNPLLFYKPYYMEAGRGGDKPYVLLREALKQSGRIAIAKVVIKTRQHLAAVKPQGEGLILELMHFPQELVDLAEFKAPAEQNVPKQELQMALRLIDSITNDWHPEEYTDEYREKLEQLIDRKIQKGGQVARVASASKTKQPANVVDLVTVLQQSIQKTGQRSKRGGPRAGDSKGSTPARARRKAA